MFARGVIDNRSFGQVIARWRPEDARRPHIEDAPVFYPTEEVSLFSSGTFELTYVTAIHMLTSTG